MRRLPPTALTRTLSQRIAVRTCQSAWYLSSVVTLAHQRSTVAEVLVSAPWYAPVHAHQRGQRTNCRYRSQTTSSSNAATPTIYVTTTALPASSHRATTTSNHAIEANVRPPTPAMDHSTASLAGAARTSPTSTLGPYPALPAAKPSRARRRIAAAATAAPTKPSAAATALMCSPMRTTAEAAATSVPQANASTVSATSSQMYQTKSKITATQPITSGSPATARPAHRRTCAGWTREILR